MLMVLFVELDDMIFLIDERWEVSDNEKMKNGKYDIFWKCKAMMVNVTLVRIWLCEYEDEE